MSPFHLTQIQDQALLFEPGPALDVSRPEHLIEHILTRAMQDRTVALYYDLARLAVIDSVYLAWLEKLDGACRAVNIEMVAVHLQPAAAYALATTIDRLPSFRTAHDLRSMTQGRRH